MSTITYTQQQSKTWLLERTYHAHLKNGKELSVPDFTRAMKQLTDCSVALSTWQEIPAEEATTLYQQGVPILLYHEQAWQQTAGAAQSWRPNRNMRDHIYGDTHGLPEATSGIEYAVCYLDRNRGNFENPSWRERFASDLGAILMSGDLNTIIFLRPSQQFPSTIHYTVIVSPGQSNEYTNRREAIEGFAATPPFKVEDQHDLVMTFPQLCYYHEIVCPDGIYRLVFLGPMDEPG